MLLMINIVGIEGYDADNSQCKSIVCCCVLHGHPE